MTSSTTLIRVPVAVHGRIRAVADSRDETYGQVISHGLDLIEQEKFWAEVATLVPDANYVEEFADWDSAELR
jgi:hypothetical protein